ncbi:MAG: TIGR01777 family protein [Acidobacteria bacterium]|nr:TIGR01777 family protein [Acidobacteriota bacterium]MYJ02770.1 TIGR01777 family protein [Acidobacteriota bacterium]
MTVLLTGGTGFIGSRLKTRLEELGHTVRVVSRGPGGDVTWDPDAIREAVSASDAVLHLAGENVIGRRWTARQKERLRESRVDTTQLLAQAVADAGPAVFVTASAIGYYGFSTFRRFTERDGAGDDFLAQLSVEWEAARQPAIDAGVRTATIRIGVVQHPGGGALGKMLLPFRLGVGGPVGSGEQWISWIHMDDLLAMFEWAIANDQVSGVYNGTAPNPATNLAFSRALGRVLRRPAILPAPSFALRLALGEAAELLVQGQHVLPERALAEGFEFRFPEVEPALRDLLS